ncbi:MAG: potassium transporter TrkA [Verrucomicrobia bacterium]|nr:potassium transporter TrkA [Verrucomicrobiota bacterium]
MGALLALLTIVTFALLVVRVGSKALMMTGLSWDTASFQAYSAFFGVGFTTKEAEMVVDHPVRRRIIKQLILFGNIGLTSAFATLVVTFVQTSGVTQTLETAGLILGGLLGLVLLSKIKVLGVAVDAVIQLTLERAGVSHVLDYDLLLRVQSGYCVSEIDVQQDSPLAGATLAKTRPADQGIIVLGITSKDGFFHGVPGPSDRVEVGDVITVYGKEGAIRKLACEDADCD